MGIITRDRRGHIMPLAPGACRQVDNLIHSVILRGQLNRNFLRLNAPDLYRCRTVDIHPFAITIIDRCLDVIVGCGLIVMCHDSEYGIVVDINAYVVRVYSGRACMCILP